MRGPTVATTGNPPLRRPTRRGRGIAMGHGMSKGRKKEAGRVGREQNPWEWGETLGPRGLWSGPRDSRIGRGGGDPRGLRSGGNPKRGRHRVGVGVESSQDGSTCHGEGGGVESSQDDVTPKRRSRGVESWQDDLTPSGMGGGVELLQDDWTPREAEGPRGDKTMGDLSVSRY